VNAEATDLRAWIAAKFHYEQGIKLDDLAELFGLSTARICQLVRTGKQRNGVTVVVPKKVVVPRKAAAG
jgi:DNA-binding transcriptional regulator LsrR (DeoR family)